MSESDNRTMHLGLFVSANGHHAGGWRHPQAEAGSPLDLDYYRSIALQAERAKLDMLFIADKLAIDDIYGGSFDMSVSYRPSLSAEPITLISALGAVTERIGIAATASTTYHEPFHIARMFATVDHLSKGRAAWNVVTSTSDGEARNFGKAAHLDHATRYERAAEFIDVVRKLWDSWEDDALTADKESGVYADSGKVHYAAHKGPWFDVKGPLNVARPPQGQPLVIQAGSSETFRELAAKGADLIFTVQPKLEAGQAFYRDVKARVAKHGRSPDVVHILPGIMPIIGRTEAEAREKQQWLNEHIHPNAGLCFMSGSMNYDLSQHPLDGPFPDILDRIRGSRGRFEYVIRQARDNGWTLAETGSRYAASRSHHVVVGTVLQVADAMEQWFKERACDGFNLMAPFMPQGLNDLLEGVVPELQNRGLFRSEYAGSTLRDHFGLSKPRNRNAPLPADTGGLRHTAFAAAGEGDR